jgi:transcriptional regulator with XRE-family HTH domain
MSIKKASAIDRHVSKRLREARKAAGLNQEYIANKLGVSFQQIEKYEKANNRISAGRLFEISELVGVPIGYFFEGLTVTVPAKAKTCRQPKDAPPALPPSAKEHR